MVEEGVADIAEAKEALDKLTYTKEQQVLDVPEETEQETGYHNTINSMYYGLWMGWVGGGRLGWGRVADIAEAKEALDKLTYTKEQQVLDVPEETEQETGYHNAINSMYYWWIHCSRVRVGWVGVGWGMVGFSGVADIAEVKEDLDKLTYTKEQQVLYVPEETELEQDRLP